MSNYKYPTPQLLLKAICDTIRAKTGSNNKIAHQDIPDELDSILTEEECEIAARELSNIIYGSEVKVLDSKYILNIARYKFYGSGLTTVNLPECTSMGEYAFSSCTSLTTVNLPKCTSIGGSAFNSCTSLTTVSLPECTSIEDYAFYCCTSLTTIIFGADQVVYIDDISTFNNSAIANGTGYVYVPDNLVDSYKTATNWSTYANQIKPISELSDELKEEYNL